MAQLSFVGDLMVSDSAMMFNRGFRSTYEINKSISKDIKKIFFDSDLVFGNLESSVDFSNNNFNYKKYQPYLADKVIINFLKDSGFNLINLANNHSLQYGKENYKSTVKELLNSGINVIGVKNDSDIQVSKLVKCGDFNILFLGFCLKTQKIKKELIEKQLLQHKEEADVIILSLHWGDEHINHPSPEQVKFARSLIDSGVDVIIGHHSHVIQGVEKYKSGIIAYGLGNFISDTGNFGFKYRLGAILNLKIQPGKIDYSIFPMFINKKFMPTLISDTLSKKVLEYFSLQSNKIKEQRLNSIYEKQYYNQVKSCIYFVFSCCIYF